MSGIEELLRRTMGLEASSIGAATVERAARFRMMKVGVPTTDDYLSLLRESPEELHELIEAVVVPESWFFRDGAPFVTLRQWTLSEWLPAHPKATLRILTVPCSTGEEPYSAAMTLLDAGLPAERFTVDAMDISRHALARAERAVYGSNSFRGKTLDFRERHFQPAPDGYALAPEVRRQVRFEQGNLLAAGFQPGAGQFDVIFCRNLLIYFDRPTQAQAVKTLGGMLASDGLFFVGHAETGAMAGSEFVPANYAMSFAFRKTASASLLPPVQPPSSKTKRLSPAPPLPAQPRVTRWAFAEMPAVSPSPARLMTTAFPATDDLDSARQLADLGRLEEAAKLCETHLQNHGASAAAWYLLGLVRDAAGDRKRAAECYAKTLYLEPDHLESLLQQALLAEQADDVASAAQFRRRILRVQQRTTRA